MKKVPTIFDRDWDGDRSRVVDLPHPDCAWVFAGEGTATLKLDGSCCLVRDGRLYKRHEVKDGKRVPEGFVWEEDDFVTKKTVGWLPVGEGPEDRWHREAWGDFVGTPLNGTYELLGPKVQGNVEKREKHQLVSHDGTGILDDAPRTFDGLRDYLAGKDIEGIVFHHPDGRMGKIKLRDFGLKRGQEV